MKWCELNLKRLGIRYRKAYNTRHTYATVMLMKRINPAYIAPQLGRDVKTLLEKTPDGCPNTMTAPKRQEPRLRCS